MDDVLPFLGFAVLAVLVVVGGSVQKRRRRDRTQAWAQAHEWTFAPSDFRLVHRWQREPFGRGREAEATEVLRGVVRGRQVTSFTYRWTTGSGDDRSTQERHVVAVELPGPVPYLELTPEGVGSRIATAFGAQDIALESEEFDRAWRVRADDPRFALDVVHRDLMATLLRPPARGTRLRFEAQAVLSWTRGTTDLDRVLERAEVLCAVADAIPPHVWERLGTDPHATR